MPAALDIPGDGRLLPRRTFTVEVWVDGETDRVVATRVVHLETRVAAAWPGWSRSRLLGFLENRASLAGRQDPATRPAGTGRATDPTGLVLHRFGLLTVAEPVTRGGAVSARLRLDPAGLDLPAGLTAVAHVELIARPIGAGRPAVVDVRVIDLTEGAVDVVLGGRLPDREPPFAVQAAVRVLVDQPSGPPREGLGGASLRVVPAPGPTVARR